MNVTVVGINYYPEITSTGLYTTQMCEWLARRGHKINVITAFPFYPEWKIHNKYQGEILQKENINGVNVYRSYVYVPEIVTSKSRIVHEISFGLSCFFNIIKQMTSKPDIIISICPPFQLGIHGYLMASIMGIPFIYHIQDLQVDAAVELNMIRNRVLIKLLQKIELFLFKKADIVSTISIGMREKIISKGIDDKKVKLFPNWANIEDIKPQAKMNQFRYDNSISDNEFVLLYAGNIGEKQGLETILETAKLLRSEERYKFIFVGSGARKKHLITEAAKSKLKNILFLDTQPREMLAKMLNAADLCLVPQQKSVTDIVMPSKLTNILSCGRPVLVSANENCEVSKVVSRYQCGVVIEPEEPQVMLEAILNLSKDQISLEKMGENGRRYAEESLDMNKIILKFEKDLKACKRERL